MSARMHDAVVRWGLACLLASLCMPATDALGFQATPPAGRVEVRAWLDRTAIWVGDRVTYTLEVRCPKGTDILDSDLSKERLTLEGLEVVSTEAEQESVGEDIVRRVRYTLTTSTVDRPTLRVAPFTFRYYVKRPGQRVEDATPAGELTVPGAVVALRSVLPDDPTGLALRDSRGARARPLAYRLVQPVGLALVLVSLLPALVWTAGGLRRWWQRPERQVARRARREERTSLEAVRALDLSSIGGRRAAYDGLDMLVRRHVSDVFGVECAGLTSAELTEALAAWPPTATEAVRALIAECERARYGPPHLWPSEEACRSALEQASSVLSRR